MPEELVGNVLVGQSGGPTAVVNASLAGVVAEALNYASIEEIYGSLNGVLGILNEDFIDLAAESQQAIRGLRHTPGAALGTCRFKLKKPSDLDRVIQVFKAHNIRYFFYIGGNDSQDTADKISKHAAAQGHEMRVIGIPWGAMCRADGISRAGWGEMARSGCFGVKLGFESGSQWVIDNILGKKLDLNAARDLTFFLRSLGMSVHGTFTYGLPGETVEQRRATKEYMGTLPLTSFQETTIAELDGTPIHTLREKGELKAYPGAHFGDNAQQEQDVNRKRGRIAAEDFP